MPTEIAYLKGHPVGREQIVDAMARFDLDAAQKNWESNPWQHYVVVHETRRYPPKLILSIATGRPVRSFHGGKESNHVFVDLGFDVVKKTGSAAIA